MRGAGFALPALLLCVPLSGCADREPEPPASGSAATSETPPSANSSSPAAAAPLPGLPTPRSSGDSPIDPARLRSADDLPTVFGCPDNVQPIRIPATSPTSGATTPPAPEAVVCASALADREALYLWFTPTPEAKLGALTEAFARAKYVHAGPNWVAAGQISPTLGTIGGEVYR